LFSGETGYVQDEVQKKQNFISLKKLNHIFKCSENQKTFQVPFLQSDSYRLQEN
tara:strand:- start:277 stop:438 length:162 start_codon:yes stop_codon:yes gene_type:complete